MSLVLFTLWLIAAGTMQTLVEPHMTQLSGEDRIFEHDIVHKQQPAQPAGIRFVLINDLPEKVAFVITNDNEMHKTRLRRGMVDSRMRLPEDRKIIIAGSEPIKGRPLDIILESTVPNVADRMLGIISRHGSRYTIDYMRDGGLIPGMTLFKNLTGEPFLLELPEYSEEISLEPNGEFLFNKPRTTREAATTRATLKHKTTIQGKQTDWLVFRRFMITSSSARATIRVLTKDASGNMIMHDIAIFPEQTES